MLDGAAAQGQHQRIAGGQTGDGFMFTLAKRGFAVTSEKRSPYVPEVPTMAESGMAGYAEAGSDLWFGIVGPAGIPKPIVTKLNEPPLRR